MTMVLSFVSLNRTSRPELFCEKGFPQNSQEDTCVGLSFLMRLQSSGLHICQGGGSDAGVYIS